MKIGLLLLAGQWLETIGANKGFYSSLPQILKSDALKIKKLLPEDTEVIDPGIVNSREKAAKAAALFKEKGADAILISYLAWGEDWLFLEAIKNLPETPVLLWSCVPSSELPKSFDMVQLFRYSGPVGAMQASGPLKRMGRKFCVISGSTENKETADEIKKFVRAAEVTSKLKNLTVGLLPSVCDSMSGTHIEEKTLKKQLGISVKHISLEEYCKSSESIFAGEVKKCADFLKRQYKVEVSDKALLKGARASLGLLRILDKYNLRALAFNDLDEKLHIKCGLRPCLAIPGIFEKTVISMEGDVGAAAAMYILRELTGKSPMYTEIFTYDEKENAFLAGHAGILDAPALVQSAKYIRIVKDYEYMEVEKDTAAMQFTAKSGTVTMLNIFFTGKEFQMFVLRGKSVRSGKNFDISPSIYIKPEINVNEFMKKVMSFGTTQHWAVVHQDAVKELKSLEDAGLNMTNIEI